ncbi:MAG: hypothetical protein SFZ23_08155 [Planctomycetota bacterium]|nr:hypothetical protein [Planctomycetota bacterium]
MFKTLKATAAASATAVQARVQVAVKRAELAATGAFVANIGLRLLGVAIIGLLAALAMALGPHVGWPGAVAISSAIGVSAAVGVLLLARRLAGGDVHEPRRTLRELIHDRDAADAEVRRLVSGASSTARTAVSQVRTKLNTREGPMKAQSTESRDKAMFKILEDPKVALGAAFTMLTVFGPIRAIKIVSRGAAFAGIVAALREAGVMGKSNDNQHEQHDATRGGQHRDERARSGDSSGDDQRRASGGAQRQQNTPQEVG